MARTGTKMGLRFWDQGDDLYDHVQQASNFAKIEFHDHTENRGVQIPTEGLLDGAVTQAKVASNAVGFSNMDTNAQNLWHTYRTIKTGFICNFNAGVAAGTYLFQLGGPGAQLSTVSPNIPFHMAPGDYNISGGGVATKYRLKGAIFNNGTDSGTSFVVSLYPLSGLLGGSVTVLTMGSPVASMTMTYPGSTNYNSNSVEFDPPTQSFWALGATTSATTAASSQTWLQVDIQVKYTG